MFESLPHVFRSHEVAADTRTLLLLRQSIDKGLVRTLGDLYAVLKAFVVKSPNMEGPYTKAFYDYFLSIDIQRGEKLSDAVARSKAFKVWKAGLDDTVDEAVDDDKIKSLTNRFLDEVHLTSYDIQQMLDGNEILDKDNPDMEDRQQQNNIEGQTRPNRAADYSQTSLQELMKRMERVAEMQRYKHQGGSHWIGTGGVSPYGHSGAAKGGIRVGGKGGGGMARHVVDDPQFYPVDMGGRLNDDNIDAALAALKGVIEATSKATLDVESTIRKGLKRGGLFLPEEKMVTEDKLQVILMIDNGGYSMDPHIMAVTKLFKKMKTRFAHDMETYYFHNTIYNHVATDVRRTDHVPIDKLLAHGPDYSVFIIGDASMAPYELTHASMQNWVRIKQKFKKIAWLNPERPSYWDYSHTIIMLRRLFPMFPLTPKGIAEAVRQMNKHYAPNKHR